jgi:hypothetical protein
MSPHRTGLAVAAVLDDVAFVPAAFSAAGALFLWNSGIGRLYPL